MRLTVKIEAIIFIEKGNDVIANHKKKKKKGCWVICSHVCAVGICRAGHLP